MPVSKALLDILCCPKTKAPLVVSGDRLISTDKETRLSYAVIENVPVLLIDKATTLTVEEWQQAMNTFKS